MPPARIEGAGLICLHLGPGLQRYWSLGADIIPLIVDWKNLILRDVEPASASG